MSLRKLAAFVAALGLLAGLLANGLIAQFTDQVTGTENINVGTFACKITDATPGGAIIAGDGKSVTYTAPTIMSSAPDSAPFSFTVQNTGTIGDVLTVSTSPVTDPPFSIIGAPFAPVALAPGGSHTYDTGVAWSELDNTWLGAHGTVTWTVDCGENLGIVVFDNTPAVLPGNLASEAFEAQSASEWGTQAGLAGTARKLSKVVVTMSSWGCENGHWYDDTCATTPGSTFPVPITFNLYNVGAGNAVGSLIASRTQTFNIPYRPSADNTNCTGGDLGKWFNGASCFNGKAVNITFDFSGLLPTLPNDVIFGIAFNTTHYGYAPIGEGAACYGSSGGCGYDSLNVATDPGTGVTTPPSVGTFPLPLDGAYLNSSWTGAYNDGGAGGTGTFRLDPSGWGGYEPSVQMTAKY